MTNGNEKNPPPDTGGGQRNDGGGDNADGGRVRREDGLDYGDVRTLVRRAGPKPKPKPKPKKGDG